MKFITYIQKNLIYLIPVSIILGIIFGKYENTSFFKNLILPITFLMIYPQMVNLNIKKILEKPNHKLKTAAILINFVLLPLTALFLGNIFFKDSPLDAIGLLLIALLPTGSMTMAFTGMTKGNLAAAIRISVFGLFMAAFLAPIYLYQLKGEVIDIPLLMMTKKILLVIFVPLILGYLTRIILIKKAGNEKSFKETYGKNIAKFSGLGVISMIFIIMAMKSDFILNNPQKVLFYMLPLFLFYSIAFLTSTTFGKLFFNKKDAIALVYGTSLRHLSIALAIAVTSFGTIGSEIALIISIAFVFQVKMGAWYAKFIDEIFDKK